MPKGYVHIKFKFGNFVKEFVNPDLIVAEDGMYSEPIICKNDVYMVEFLNHLKKLKCFDTQKATKMIDANFKIESNIQFYKSNGDLLTQFNSKK